MEISLTDSFYRDINTMNKVISELLVYFKKCKEVIAVYLYGSVVYSKQPHDIDIAVLVDETKISNSLLYRAHLITELEGLLKFPVDVLILNNANLLFRAQVFRKGKLIFERNPRIRAKFQADSMSLYYDYKRYFDFHAKNLCKKIKDVGLG